MDSTTRLIDRSLITATLDSGFDSCTASGNMSSTVNPSDLDILEPVSGTDNLNDNNSSDNYCEDDREIESPSTPSDSKFKINPKNNRTSSADSGSTFEILDDSSQSPTSYHLVEDSPTSENLRSYTQRNFPKLELNVSNHNVLSGSIINQIDNRFQSLNESSIKICEVSHDEERDTFSPISNNGHINDQICNETTFSCPSTSGNIPKSKISTVGRQKDNSSIGIVENTLCSSEVHNLSFGSPLNLPINPNCSNNSNIHSSILTSVGDASGNGSGSASSNNSDLDNKIFEKKKIKSTSTKEEKQRQNEEIVIMETSSVSSETGSWESVFPHNSSQPSNVIASGTNYLEVKDIASEKYVKLDEENKGENSNSQPGFSQTQTVTASCPISACFIDAASLLDESEVYPPTLPENGCFGPKPTCPIDNLSANVTTLNMSSCTKNTLSGISRQHLLSNGNNGTEASTLSSPEETSQISASSQSTNSESWKKKLNLDKLETFHKSFELCKTKSIDAHNKNKRPDDRDSNTSSSSSDSPHVNERTISHTEENSHNLSDEEKLWKRENSKKTRRIEVKDQFNKESPNDTKIGVKIFSTSHVEETGQASNVNTKNSTFSAVNSCINEAEEKEMAVIRKDQERKQGNLIFQNNIQQFSGHIINPKIPFNNGAPVPQVSKSNGNIPVTEQNNFIEYLGESPGPSLAWSDVEGNINRFSNYEPADVFGDGSDYGEQSSNFSNSRLASDSGGTSASCILPDTPHNSIVQIGQSTKVIKDSALQNDDLDNISQGIKIPKKLRCDDSAPIVSGGASIKDFTPKQCESPPVRRKTETCPIVSGGFISLDLQRGDDDLESNAVVKTSRDKPKLKQQTWVVDMSDCSINGKRRRSTSSSSSTENTARSISSFERNTSGNSQRSGLGFYVSLNDMEPPKSIDSDYSSGTTAGCSENIKVNRSLYENGKKATGFYVDLSESENSRNATPPPSQRETLNCTPRSSTSDVDKKNIFSMFIDLGEKKVLNKKGPFSLASRLSSSLLQKKQEDIGKNEGNSLNSSSEKHDFHLENPDSEGEVIGLSEENRKNPQNLTNAVCNSVGTKNLQSTQSPVMRRTPLFQKDDLKRHSWNNPEVSSCSVSRVRTEHKEHKRSSSLSADSNDNNIMNILDKIPLISKTSSMSIDSSLSPFDDITCSKTDLSTYSNNSVTSNSAAENDLNGKCIVEKQKKRRRDVKINETFDKSSQGSITDGILSKDLSPASNTTDTDDLTFQQDENFIREPAVVISNPSSIVSNVTALKDINRPTIMETIIETRETSSPKKSTLNNESEKHTTSHTMESLHATIEKQKMLLETVNEQTEAGESGAFVRLSDLDKPIAPIKFELHSPEAIMSKSVGNQRHINRLFQETTRNRPHSWAMTRSTGNSIINITNSVENLRSLTRLFPHLSKEFSNSLPNDVHSEKNLLQNQRGISNLNSVSLMYHQRSPSEIDFINSGDISTADSSLASSFSRSALDESSISCRQPRRLGEDLLKMFLQEIGTDVIVEVNGRRIKAHKCILRSRCQYFAAMLAGGWVQSAGNVISLQGYSYSSVHFALCHIYSGACHPPDGISLMELAALADLLGLEGLKEVTTHALKSSYCHNFHKPCSGCIDGILQVLPVALNHALDDLYRKCLKWTCRHYLKVWPTRSFAQLPSEIFNRCRQQVVAHLTSESVLQAILDCDQLIAQVAHFRWAVVIENLLRDILDAAYTYISDHFASLIASDSFLSLGNDKSSDITQLENLLLRTASSLNPDQACRSYQRVTRLNAVLAAKVIKMPATISENKSSNNISNHDFGNVLILGGTEEEMEWNEEFIRLVSAILSAVEQCLTRQCSRAMRVTAWQRMDLELRKKIQKLACLTEPLDVRRNAGISNVNNKQQISFSSGSRNQDLYQVKLAIQAHSKRALDQDKQLYRASAHTQTNTHDRNTQTNEKLIQVVNNTDNIKNNFGVKASKSSLRAIQSVHVVQKVKSSVHEKLSTNGHRRTLSEDSSLSTTSNNVILRQPDNSLKQSSSRPNSLTNTRLSASNRPTSLSNTRPTSLSNRLSEIRPRYLEPRKPRVATSTGPIKVLSNNNLKVKNNQISSSDSSRNSSPATSRKIQNTQRKIGTKSINMSLDSLASPSKRSIQVKSHVQTENEISVDSLADSMRSSIITEKTISHESLRSGTKNRQISRSNPGINKIHLSQNHVKNNTTKKPLNVIQTTKLVKTKSTANGTSTGFGAGLQNTSGSSPSSITNKSSRLSSVSSTGFSPRDAFKNRSISVPVSSVSVKKSFLSAKSREILARKAANLEKVAKLQVENAKTETFDAKIALPRTKSNGINKSNSSSNIPTRLKSSSLPQSISNKKQSPNGKQNLTTINSTLMKNNQTIKLNNTQKAVFTVESKNYAEKNKTNAGQEKVKKIGKYVKDTREQKIEIIVVDNGEQLKDVKYESKLERSSTFCKETSDLPVAELEIVE
ncbi:uncharacterized protein LOC129614728 [Condylostylus longicornis]|uniref:uncharacterized protein LOC129614728 n=1 Tax=Condylostylus longicornis TaxID=2530218 RepID=UPI00244DFABD|nr:uncharacterized protein LOC129614728 [Condylostylus longicornis]